MRNKIRKQTQIIMKCSHRSTSLERDYRFREKIFSAFIILSNFLVGIRIIIGTIKVLFLRIASQTPNQGCNLVDFQCLDICAQVLRLYCELGCGFAIVLNVSKRRYEQQNHFSIGFNNFSCSPSTFSASRIDLILRIAIL